MNVIVKLNVALEVVEIVEVTSEQLDVTCLIWNRALTSKSLRHVVVLNVCQCLLRVFVSSTHQIVHVVDNREDASVHHHQVDKSCEFASKHLVEVYVENLNEGRQYNCCLGCGQFFQVSLVFELKASAVFQQEGWKTNEVDHH